MIPGQAAAATPAADLVLILAIDVIASLPAQNSSFRLRRRLPREGNTQKKNRAGREMNFSIGLVVVVLVVPPRLVTVYTVYLRAGAIGAS